MALEQHTKGMKVILFFFIYLNFMDHWKLELERIRYENYSIQIWIYFCLKMLFINVVKKNQPKCVRCFLNVSNDFHYFPALDVNLNETRVRIFWTIFQILRLVTSGTFFEDRFILPFVLLFFYFSCMAFHTERWRVQKMSLTLKVHLLFATKMSF